MSCKGKYIVFGGNKPLFLIVNHSEQDITVGGRLTRAILSRRHRIDPPMNRDECYAATHSSEHNSVFIIGKSGRRHSLQQAEWRRRREEEGGKTGKGKRVGKDTEVEERYIRGRGHDFPFSSPIPNSHGYGCPHAKMAYFALCAVVCPPLVFLTIS